MWMRRRCSGIALDVGRASLAACQLLRDRKGFKLQRWVTIQDPLRERPSDDLRDAAPRAISLCHRSVERCARVIRQSGFRGREMILALKPPEVSFLAVTVPENMLSASREQLLSGLAFEAARELQCDPKTLVVDGWRLPLGVRSGDNYMVVAIARDTVDNWWRFAESTGLSLRRIEVLPSALLRAAWPAARGNGPPPAARGRGPLAGASGDRDAEDESIWGVLDMGYASCVLTLALGPHCVYVRHLPIGGDSLTRAIQDALGLEYGAAEMLKRQYRSPRAVAQASGRVAQASNRVAQANSLWAPPERQDGNSFEPHAGGTPTLPTGHPADGAGRTSAHTDVVLPHAVHTLMRSHFKAVNGELERAFGYVMESYPQYAPSVLYLSGGGAKLGGLTDALRERLGIDVSALDPCDRLRLDTRGGRAGAGSGPRPRAADRVHLAASVGMAIGDVE